LIDLLTNTLTLQGDGLFGESLLSQAAAEFGDEFGSSDKKLVRFSDSVTDQFIFYLLYVHLWTIICY